MYLEKTNIFKNYKHDDVLNNGINNKRPFLNHLHYFRSLAILFVVAAHITLNQNEFSSPEPNMILDMLQGPFFHNGTILFVFTSGFLFQYLSHNFRYGEYISKKIKYVISPYLIISVPVIIFRISLNDYINQSVDSFYNLNPVLKFFYMIFTGQASSPFWYIPFITIVFILAPLWLTIIETIPKFFLLLTLIIPFFFPRTSNLSLNNFLYFIPVYLLGMLIAKSYEYYSHSFKKYCFIFLSLSITLLLIEYIFVRDDSIQLYINLWQKLFFIFAMLGFFSMIEKKKNKLFADIADYSFSIYFFHSFVFAIINRIMIKEYFHNLNIYLVWLISLAATFIISFYITMILKKIFGNRSRYIIGS